MNPLHAPLHTFVENLIGSSFAGAIGWTLLHSLWQGALVSALLGAVLVTARSPRVRYAAAGVAMLALIASFLATFVHFFPFASHASRAFGPSALPHWNTLADVPVSGGWRFSLAAIAPWLAPFWLVGVCLIYARSLAGCLSVRRLRRCGVCSADLHWQHELAWLAQRVRVSRPVELLESCLTDAPIVLGHFRPVILVPLGLLAGLPPAQIETILLHELAHIRRHDFLVNLLQRFAEGLLFYHPAVWWISGVMRADRELCCDDAVVSIHPDKQEYARALAALEQNRLAIREAAVAATGGNLMNRIRRLLSPQAPASNAWAPMLAAAILVVAVSVSTAAWHSKSQPQQTQLPVHNSPVTLTFPADEMQANVAKLVPPVYPEIARTANISGTIVLHAIIRADGKVEGLQYVSGPPVLMNAAMEAVRQWEYKPILINGAPIRVDTTVSVVFAPAVGPAQLLPQALPPAPLPGLPPVPPQQQSQTPPPAQSSEPASAPAQQSEEKTQNQAQSEKEKSEQDAKDAKRLARQTQEKLQLEAAAAKQQAALNAKEAEHLERRAKEEAQSQDQQAREQAGQDSKKAAAMKQKAAELTRKAQQDAKMAEALVPSENDSADDQVRLKQQKADQDAQVAGQNPESRLKVATVSLQSDRFNAWLNEDVVYVIDDAERAAFLSLKTDEERDQFIEQFWERRNPTPGSQSNAFKQEHYRRIAYANQHFAGDGIAGWRTDRGHMYIVYGPPDEIDAHPKDPDRAIGKETWLYHHIEGLGDNLEFTFIDRTGHGDYRLAPSATSPAN